MCWVTFSSKEGKRHHHHPHLHHPHLHHHAHPDTEFLVRTDRTSFEVETEAPIPTTLYPSHDYSRVRIVTPTLERHHRQHHHLHPLHMHPTRLHGHGRKRAQTPRPPPPSRRSSRSRERSRDPIYKIQTVDEGALAGYRTTVVEPAQHEVRETTRIALRETRPERRGLRRVAGYEVLAREVPWSWDCVSSVADSGARDRGRRGRSGLRFPPFGSPGSWM
ncbi:hypothetical protein K491DRAFT_208544 [Lophiostoma macrostomum CBS 122681]|uniref:Uncharacterized protein n=1 Tax=Lophiostoma macrostomum CBS 122681 TaxID=1314788 RepID=A0A6A6SN64_9PLEO|nr:hypothetical protein K491DRAFT_208544 [Lophiostoma macrostomum CBS 122681]